MRMYYDAMQTQLICRDCAAQLARSRGATLDGGDDAERVHQLAECDTDLLDEIDDGCYMCGATHQHDSIGERIQQLRSDLAKVSDSLHEIALDCPEGYKTMVLAQLSLSLKQVYRELQDLTEAEIKEEVAG